MVSILSNPNFIHKWYKLNNSLLPWAFGHSNVPNHSQNDNYNHIRLRRKFTLACPDSHSKFISHHQTGFSFSFLNLGFSFTSNEEEDRKDFGVIGSSNGFVLCKIKFVNRLCVCNPLTKKWIFLPPPSKIGMAVTGFMCNHYCFSSTSITVIRIPRFEAAVREFEIEVFSSDLGEWNVNRVSCRRDVVTWDVSFYDNFVTCNGKFYWFQKENNIILVVDVNRNKDDGTCRNECSMISLPEREMDDDCKLHHCLGESEGLVCYVNLKALEKTFSIWVLEEEDWFLVHKDIDFNDTLTEMVSWLIGRETTADLFTIHVLGFNPVDKNVVIFGYKKYIWTYNFRTKGYQQLSHPSFLHGNLSSRNLAVLTFALKPRPTTLPPISWRDTDQILDVQI